MNPEWQLVRNQSAQDLIHSANRCAIELGK